MVHNFVLVEEVQVGPCETGWMPVAFALAADGVACWEERVQDSPRLAFLVARLMADSLPGGRVCPGMIEVDGWGYQGEWAEGGAL